MEKKCFAKFRYRLDEEEGITVWWLVRYFFSNRSASQMSDTFDQSEGVEVVRVNCPRYEELLALVPRERNFPAISQAACRLLRREAIS